MTGNGGGCGAGSLNPIAIIADALVCYMIVYFKYLRENYLEMNCE